jgi:hypothetical protein
MVWLARAGCEPFGALIPRRLSTDPLVSLSSNQMDVSELANKTTDGEEGDQARRVLFDAGLRQGFGNGTIQWLGRTQRVRIY